MEKEESARLFIVLAGKNAERSAGDSAEMDNAGSGHTMAKDRLAQAFRRRS